jgi:predicted nucleotidyltransferase
MVEIPDKIKKLIKKFIDAAQEDNISISQAVLFGSYAKGTNHKWSDIDLAVVSDDFEGIRFYDNQKLFYAKDNSSFEIEPHPYRPEDFTEDNPFVKEILAHGIRII